MNRSVVFTDIGNSQIASEKTKLYLIGMVTTSSASGEGGREPVGVCALDMERISLFNVRVNRELRMDPKPMTFIKSNLRENESLSHTFNRWRAQGKTRDMAGKLLVNLGAALEVAKIAHAHQ